MAGRIAATGMHARANLPPKTRYATSGANNRKNGA
jgi:hypothetical protein